MQELLSDPDFLLFRDAVAAELAKAEIEMVKKGVWVEPGSPSSELHKSYIERTREFASALKVIDDMKKPKYKFFSVTITT